MDVSGIYNQEMIMVGNDEATAHYIALDMFGNRPMFSVECCCDDDWGYTFMYTKSNYENIKHLIIDALYECDDMDDAMNVLTDIFESEFADIMMDCDGNCEDCDYNEDED